MTNFSNKGEVSTLGTVVVECDTNTRKLIKYMSFTNPAAYQIDVDVYDKYSNTTINIVSMSLSAGDKLVDEGEIYLEKGDKITVTCDVAGTSFIVVGEEVDLKRR